MNSHFFSPVTRAENLARMAAESPPLDLVIIGGGITGAGVARDAARRGLRVGLIERRDFAAGTSGRSSKLIHGGVRYLQLGDFALVRESAVERRTLGRIAPHLVRPIRMVFPARSRRAYHTLNFGLWTYEKLGRIDASERHVMWDRDETLARVPQLRPEGLQGAVAYFESITDDARLVIDTLKDAHVAGALVANHAEVIRLHVTGERVDGVRVRDAICGREIDVPAHVVINAAGPWVDAVRNLEGAVPGKRLHLTKGIHLTLPRQLLPVEQIVAFHARDRRSVFVVPRGDVTYLGTTDTEYGAPTEYPEITAADVDYLLAAAERAFAIPPLGPEAILSAWAGLRPLLHEEGKTPSEISRKDEIIVGPTGLISIAGGKLTTYRRMAARIVDMAMQALDQIAARAGDLRPCDTHRSPLPGGERMAEGLRAFEEQLRRDHPAIPRATIARLVGTYGTQCRTVLLPLAERPELAEPVGGDRGLLGAEVVYAIDHEMALTVEDVLDRRTRRLLFATDQGLRTVDGVAAMLAERQGWNAEYRQEQTRAYRRLAASLRPADRERSTGTNVTAARSV